MAGVLFAASCVDATSPSPKTTPTPSTTATTPPVVQIRPKSTHTASGTVTPAQTPTPTPTSTPMPTASPSPEASATATIAPSASPTLVPTQTTLASPTPTVVPTPATPSPSPTPTSTATIAADTPEPEYDIRITEVFFDGEEPRYEGDEYVEVANCGSHDVELEGWVLLDADDGGPAFKFPAYTLHAGYSVRVYTNLVHPDFGGLTFGSDKAIWNNTRPDMAELRDADGNIISQRGYEPWTGCD